MVCEDSKVFRFKGTVIRKIWLQILGVGIFTAALVCENEYYAILKIHFPQALIPVLGAVTGLLLVFRTNSANDRYWEGRRLWSQITHNVRTATRYIWIGVDESEVEDLIEKVSIMNILVAFPYAMKNYLRGNYSYEAEELKELIGHLPRIVPSKLDPGNAFDGSNRPVPKRIHVEIQISSKTVAGRKMNNKKFKKLDRRRAHAEPTETNIPIEILLYFASYLNHVATSKKPPPNTFIDGIRNSMIALSDAVSGLERILQTPIPLAYAVHLEHTVWLYLITLPFQLIGTLSWWAIPAVTLATFALLGILDIGTEIENPFGINYNHLPLQEICDRIKREAYLTLGRPMVSPATWIFTEKNFPLLDLKRQSALDLSKMNIEEVRQLLAKRAEAFVTVK